MRGLYMRTTICYQWIKKKGCSSLSSNKRYFNEPLRAASFMQTHIGSCQFGIQSFGHQLNGCFGWAVNGLATQGQKTTHAGHINDVSFRLRTQMRQESFGHKVRKQYKHGRCGNETLIAKLYLSSIRQSFGNSLLFTQLPNHQFRKNTTHFCYMDTIIHFYLA